MGRRRCVDDQKFAEFKRQIQVRDLLSGTTKYSRTPTARMLPDAEVLAEA